MQGLMFILTRNTQRKKCLQYLLFLFHIKRVNIKQTPASLFLSILLFSFSFHHIRDLKSDCALISNTKMKVLVHCNFNLGKFHNPAFDNYSADQDINCFYANSKFITVFKNRCHEPRSIQFTTATYFYKTHFNIILHVPPGSHVPFRFSNQMCM